MYMACHLLSCLASSLDEYRIIILPLSVCFGFSLMTFQVDLIDLTCVPLMWIWLIKLIFWYLCISLKVCPHYTNDTSTNSSSPFCSFSVDCVYQSVKLLTLIPSMILSWLHATDELNMFMEYEIWTYKHNWLRQCVIIIFIWGGLYNVCMKKRRWSINNYLAFYDDCNFYCWLKISS